MSEKELTSCATKERPNLDVSVIEEMRLRLKKFASDTCELESSKDVWALRIDQLCDAALHGTFLSATRHNAAPQEKCASESSQGRNGPEGDSAANGAPAGAAPIPEEFARVARFYDVSDMAALVRMQQEHIEGLQRSLPPQPPYPGLQRVREG